MSIPHNPDAEAAVLGGMMLSRADRDAVLELLAAEDFYAPKHQAIFSAIVALYGTGHAIEPLSLSLELDRIGMLELVGGKAGLLQIQAEASSAGAMTYARIVADLAARRRLMAFAARLGEDAKDPDIDVETTLAQVERASDEVRLPVADVSPARTAGDLAAAATDHEYRWIVPDFLERQDRVGVTGGEGAGKSTLLRQWSVQLASGIHPWFLYPMDPASVLYVDLQDTEAQAGRAFGRMIQVAGEHYDDRRLHVVCWREGIDLRNRRDFRRIDRLMEIHQPDVLVLGPHYKCYKVRSGERSVDEQPAIECSLALDELLARHDAALLMEMHSPHGSGGDREGLRPYGPSLWLRWPEFGFGLKKEPGPASTAPARVVDWRGARDRTRLMPTKFTPTGKWPWSAQLEGED